MAKEIEILVFDGENFDRRTITNDLDGIQQVVGGLFEMPFLNTEIEQAGIGIIVNEEGKLMELPYSIGIMREGQILDVLCGDVLFARRDEKGNMTGLNEEDFEFIKI